MIIINNYQFITSYYILLLFVVCSNNIICNNNTSIVISCAGCKRHMLLANRLPLPQNFQQLDCRPLLVDLVKKRRLIRAIYNSVKL